MHHRNRPRWIWGIAACLILTGCSREWYRQQADEEAACLIQEKSYHPWDRPFEGVDMDPRSRYFHPYDPVRPPMPPDDPDAHQLMHYIDDKKHWSHWHDNGDISELENPCWRDELLQYVRLTDDGKVFLNLRDSVRLARMHSPNFQQQIETLYLSALDVSTERFRFDTQFFGGIGGGQGRTFFTDASIGVAGPQAGFRGDSTDVAIVSNFGLRRRLATAGELLIGFANSFVWQFSGRDTNFAMSTINFSLIQPLLRGASRQIALETLTISERQLLANLRAFAFYQTGFFTQVAIGENNTQGPNRRGGFTGGSGLSGFSGLGSGGFGGVGDATGFGRNAGQGGQGGVGGGAAGSGFAGGGAGTVGGFIGLLQQYQQIRNTETSLRAQLQTLELLEAHLDAGLIDIAQVDQFRQSIETERASLLQTRNALENSLEVFKSATLGLPPDLPISLDDSMIQPFQFLDPDIQSLQSDLQTIVRDFGVVSEDATVENVRGVLARLGTLKTRIQEQFEIVAADVQRVETVRENRFTQLEPAEQKLFENDYKQLVDNLQVLKDRFAETGTQISALDDQLSDQNLKQSMNDVIAVNVVLTNLLSELALVQARARLETVTLDTLELTPETAIEIARCNRLDWMNNRAALVDTWRLIEFNADRLESNVDIFINGDLGTVRDNPVSFRAENGTLEAGLRFDAPFNRLVERNDFRQQLLVYQQARRQMIQYEDTVFRNLRTLLRELEQLRVNLEIQRRAVAIAIRRVDQTRENLNRPTPPALPGEPPAQFGPTAALNLLTALSDLRSSQNAFMSVWLNYYAGRMRIMRELGIMRIDEEGQWVEESIESALMYSAQSDSLPPEVPQHLFDTLDALDAGKSPPPPPAPVAAPEGAAPAQPGDAKVPLLPEPNKLPGEAAHARPAPKSVLPVSGTQAPIPQPAPTPPNTAPEPAKSPGWRRTSQAGQAT